MKKVLCCLLSGLMIVVCLGLFACDKDNGTNNETYIDITLDNYKEYLSISARVYGSGSSFWSNSNGEYQYSQATGSATITGVSFYEFIDCVINVQINFYFGSDHRSIDVPVNLNRSGAGENKESIYLTGGSWCGSWITKHASYTVTSVSGKIQRAV